MVSINSTFNQRPVGQYGGQLLLQRIWAKKEQPYSAPPLTDVSTTSE